MIYIIVSLNLVSTVFGIYWLTQKVKYQQTIIEDQTRQIANLDKYTSLLTQITDKLDPKTVLKLLDNERHLMAQDIEILKRKTVKDLSAVLHKEWGQVIEKRVMPLYNETMSEFSNFIFFYFSSHHYPDKVVRNGDIRLYFPKNADMIIAYLDEVQEKPENQ